MAWRARIHHLTRNPAFLLRASFLILAAGLGLGLLLAAAQSAAGPGHTTAVIQSMIDPGEERLREGAQELLKSAAPQPRRLARWLRRACLREVGDPAKKSDSRERGIPVELGGQEIAPLLERHAPQPEVQVVFVDYIHAALGTEEAEAAQQRLQDASEEAEPPAFANLLLGQLLVQQERLEGAVTAFMTEGKRFADARASRAEALHWAVHLRDVPRVKDMLATAGWSADAEPELVYHAAGLTGDVWLQWRMLVKLRLEDMPLAKLGLAVFAIGLWHVILVQLSGQRGRWRWSLPLLPLAAGVASIWPTLSLVTFQEQHLGLSEHAPFPHNLWYFFGGIGLREELCKLAFFVPFLPWLLRQKNAGLALITGAFVGLGFALEENINYYDPSGGSVVWGRFITANFLHLALTGIAAHGLYVTVRSGFTRLADFFGAFAGVVAAHGLYDLLILTDDDSLLGLGAFSIIVLFFVARHFFTLVEQELRAARGAVSPLSVFFLGSAVLIAALFVMAGWVGGTTQAIAEVGTGCLGVVPVGFMFWKHLH